MSQREVHRGTHRGQLDSPAQEPADDGSAADGSAAGGRRSGAAVPGLLRPRWPRPASSRWPASPPFWPWAAPPTIRRRLRALQPPARHRRRRPAIRRAVGVTIATPFRVHVRLRGASALPAGYYRFTNSTGFSIGVPAGWQISRVGHYVYIRDPANSGIFLLIDQFDQPQPNALADWQQQAAPRPSSYPDYHLIRLQAVSYPQAKQAADWEFSYDRNGIIVHILSRNVLANARHAYALYWSTPESDWKADYHYFTAFAATFRPAGVNQG